MSILATVSEAESFDFQKGSEFAAVLPGWALSKNVLGVPVKDLDKLVENVEASISALDLGERAAAFGFLFDYLGDYLRQRSEQPPRGDMVDTSGFRAAARKNGCSPTWRSSAYCSAAAFSVVIAGYRRNDPIVAVHCENGNLEHVRSARVILSRGATSTSWNGVRPLRPNGVSHS